MERIVKREEVIKIGITGQSGFIGSHIANTINTRPDEMALVTFQKDFFDDREKLSAFIEECDVIIHLAGMNRHQDQQVIYQTNIDLTWRLIEGLENCQSPKHVLFSSSAQELKENLYGLSKKESRLALENWAKSTGNRFTGLIIPNVFGPFGKPFYNSVVATFCHQINHNEVPKIDQDGQLNLIYVAELVDYFLKGISSAAIEGEAIKTIEVPHTWEIKVSELLALLNHFDETYLKRGEVPTLRNAFELNLFNTFRCYMPFDTCFPAPFKLNEDDRGAFVELARMGISGQSSFSTTKSGITRGNHYHTRKIERFAVIKGKALIQLRKVGTEKVYDYYLDGEKPAYVDMPIWYTHNIKNIGEEPLYTVFWINEPYDPSDPDTYFLTV